MLALSYYSLPQHKMICYRQTHNGHQAFPAVDLICLSIHSRLLILRDTSCIQLMVRITLIQQIYSLDQMWSILSSLCHTICPFFLKYRMRCSFTSLFRYSYTLMSRVPMYLSEYPTLKSSMLRLGSQRILSRASFTVLIFFFDYQGWQPSWITSKRSLTVPIWKRGTRDLYYTQWESCSYLSFCFSTCLCSLAFPFFFSFFPPPVISSQFSVLFLLLSPFFSFSISFLNSSSEMESSSFFSVSFLISCVEMNILFLLVLRIVLFQPQTTSITFSFLLSYGNLMLTGLLTKTAMLLPSCPVWFFPQPYNLSLLYDIFLLFSMLSRIFCCMLMLVIPSTFSMYFFSRFTSFLPSIFSTRMMFTQSSKPSLRSHDTTLSLFQFSRRSSSLNSAMLKLRPPQTETILLPLRSGKEVAVRVVWPSLRLVRTHVRSSLFSLTKQAVLLPTQQDLTSLQGQEMIQNLQAWMLQAMIFMFSALLCSFSMGRSSNMMSFLISEELICPSRNTAQFLDTTMSTTGTLSVQSIICKLAQTLSLSSEGVAIVTVPSRLSTNSLSPGQKTLLTFLKISWFILGLSLTGKNSVALATQALSLLSMKATKCLPSASILVMHFCLKKLNQTDSSLAPWRMEGILITLRLRLKLYLTSSRGVLSVAWSQVSCLSMWKKWSWRKEETSLLTEASTSLSLRVRQLQMMLRLSSLVKGVSFDREGGLVSIKLYLHSQCFINNLLQSKGFICTNTTHSNNTLSQILTKFVQLMHKSTPDGLGLVHPKP